MARSITTLQGNSEKQVLDGHRFRNGMPYVFAVVKDELGLAGDPQPVWHWRTQEDETMTYAAYHGSGGRQAA